jgi:hypothetical protein
MEIKGVNLFYWISNEPCITIFDCLYISELTASLSNQPKMVDWKFSHVWLKSSVFWDVKRCVVRWNSNVSEKHGLHLQNRRQVRNCHVERVMLGFHRTTSMAVNLKTIDFYYYYYYYLSRYFPCLRTSSTTLIVANCRNKLAWDKL